MKLDTFQDEPKSLCGVDEMFYERGKKISVSLLVEDLASDCPSKILVSYLKSTLLLN